jgi:hypothetical protein
MFERDETHKGQRAALDYQQSAAHNGALVVKLASNRNRIRTRQRRVQSSTRRPGGLERCWTALPIAPAGARLAKPARALVVATALTRSRFDVPVRFG